MQDQQQKKPFAIVMATDDKAAFAAGTPPACLKKQILSFTIKIYPNKTEKRFALSEESFLKIIV